MIFVYLFESDYNQTMMYVEHLIELCAEEKKEKEQFITSENCVRVNNTFNATYLLK